MNQVRFRPFVREYFGSAAMRISSRIGCYGIILAGDISTISALASSALALRRGESHFVLSMHVDDVRVRSIAAKSRELCAIYSTWDEVRLRLDAYAETILDERHALPNSDRERLAETIRLADSVLVRSRREHARLVDAVGPFPRAVDIVINEDPAVPTSVGDARADIVVYAPLQHADELAPFVTALNDLEIPVTIVACNRPTLTSSIRFEPPERAAAALGRARIIVDATDNDPGVALRLAKLGRPLVVSAVGGATEVMCGVGSYDIWDRRSIRFATVQGLNAGSPEAKIARETQRRY